MNLDIATEDMRWHGKVALCFLALASIFDGIYAEPISIKEKIKLVDNIKDQIQNIAEERLRR